MPQFNRQKIWAAAGMTAATVIAFSGQAAPAYAALSRTVYGRVLDGSGHGWPLYARVDGFPAGPVYTDPATGRYTASIPRGSSFALVVTALYPGYLPATTAASGDVTVRADPDACSAPGYRPHFAGIGESFTNSDAPTGWTAVDHTGGGGWDFSAAGEWPNETGGEGAMVVVSSDPYRSIQLQDAELRTPVVDLTGVSAPIVQYDTRVFLDEGRSADLGLSLDGGATWQPLRHTVVSETGRISVPIPQAMGARTVQVRWRYSGDHGGVLWEVDNVIVGKRTCQPVHGGLIVGRTTDANTRTGLDGVKVTSVDNPADSALSTSPQAGAGFYWFFSALTGRHAFTAAHNGYLSSTRTVDVVANRTTRSDFVIRTGRIAVRTSPLTTTLRAGTHKRTYVSVVNTGAAPATVSIDELGSTFDTGDDAWTSIAPLPSPVYNGAAAAGDGKLYSVGGRGTDGVATAAANVYDSTTGVWSPIASLHSARQAHAAAYVGGKVYVVGGRGPDEEAVPSMEIYDPAKGVWTFGAPLPGGRGVAASAVLDGAIYVVSDCYDPCVRSEMHVYSPTPGTWRQLADYPTRAAQMACGGLIGHVYCAGGADLPGDGVGLKGTTRAFGYNPPTNTWSRIADLPIDLYGMSYSATSENLLVSGGVTTHGFEITNKTFSYSPGHDSWTPLADALTAAYGSVGACGFFKVGGSGRRSTYAAAEVLAGHDHCARQDTVPWMSLVARTFTLAPGRSIDLAITLDAGTLIPGVYNARLSFATTTPYDAVSLPVRVTVVDPKLG